MRVLLSLLLGNSTELTAGNASAALDTLSGIDSVRGKLVTGCNIVGLSDSVNRAVLSALAAADTNVLVDREGKKALTCARRALLVYNVSDILVTEELKRCKNGVGSGLSKTAKRVGLDILAKLLKSVKVLKGALAVGDFVKYFKKSSRTYTAGSALTAGLVNRELKEELGHIDHTVVLIHNDKTARAHHTADGNKVIVVNLGVDKACGDTSAGGTAGLRCLKLLSVRYTAAYLVNYSVKGNTHRNLNKTGMVYFTAKCEYLGALGFLSTHRSEPIYTVKDDLRNVCEGLNVVLNCRRIVKTLNSRIRRTGTGLTVVTLDRGHKSSLLTANERACTKSDVKLKVES